MLTQIRYNEVAGKKNLKERFGGTFLTRIRYWYNRSFSWNRTALTATMTARMRLQHIVQIIAPLLQMFEAGFTHMSLNQSTGERNSSTQTLNTKQLTGPYVRMTDENRINYQLKTEYGGNWTHSDIATLLKQHGYIVKMGSSGKLFALLGDILYYPEELLPELGMLSERRNLLQKKTLWLDKAGIATVHYYYDTSTHASEKVFEKAVKTWSDSTCINFVKLAPNTCNANLGHAAVCVGSFGGCHSLLGRKYGPGMMHSQEMSVMEGGCEVAAAAHEFGHALGLAHEMSRADRDEYIAVRFNNIEIKLKSIKDDRSIRGGWFQGGKCIPEQMYDTPKPYDPMSLMQYGSSDFAGEDSRPVYLHHNAHYQYMFDYHRTAGYVQTHYDMYVINAGYQCIARWKKACQSNGKGAPNCKNFGYITKDCKCACPMGFSGSTCSSKSGPMFPLQDRAKAQLDVTKPGLVDMAGKGMHVDGKYPNSGFVLCQYIGVYITSGDGTRSSAQVIQDFSKVQSAYSKYQSSWIEKPINDCMYGITMFVGNQKSGSVRTECISSLINNEFPEESRVFRSMNNTMSIVAFANWAVTPSHDADLTRRAMQFKFNIIFLDKPEEHLDLKKVYPGKLGAAIDETTKEVIKGLTNHLPIVIAVGVTIVLVVIGVIAFIIWRKKKRDEPKQHSANFFGVSSNSSSSYSSD